jgi:ribosomal protein S18 acetylase RimI-like enzyme
MTTKQITPDTQDEQIPWKDLVGLISTMKLDFTAYYQDENLIGFTIVYPRKQFNWFWYFAVKPDLRGAGLVQQILTMLIEKYKDSSNILDMESPEQICDNLEQRKRRQAFYLRNGFRNTGLYKSYGDIEMTIMINGNDTFTMKDWDEVSAELWSFWKWDEK